jgi:hypothetical protein
VKKVRYALGVAGLAPVAAGMLAPAAHAATADTATYAQGATGKTVSLAATGCTGHTRTAKHTNLFGIQYYYTVNGQNTCVGTVAGWHGNPGNWEMKVYVDFDNIAAIYNCGKHTHSCTIGIHSTFYHFSRICEYWYSGATNKGGICRSPIPGGSYG